MLIAELNNAKLITQAHLFQMYQALRDSRRADRGIKGKYINIKI